jgi:small-conductance mechanosensitive channel
MLKRLRTYEQAVLPEVDEGDAGVSSADDRAPGPPVDEEGKTMTNLGMFRRYIERYLRRSPRISQTHTQMVRHLEPTRDGIPLEIYAFTNDARWTVYEQIQSDLFEHFMAMAPKYELMLFQGPAGRDLRTWGMGEGGAAGRAGPGDGREATP